MLTYLPKKIVHFILHIAAVMKNITNLAFNVLSDSPPDKARKIVPFHNDCNQDINITVNLWLIFNIRKGACQQYISFKVKYG